MSNFTDSLRAFDLIWSIPVALVLTGISHVLRNGVFVHLGHFFGVPKEHSTRMHENCVLEAAYKDGNLLEENTLKRLSKQTDMTVRQIQRWHRRRAKNDSQKEIQKFAESFWRLCLRLPIFLLGLELLRKKVWFWKTRYVWIDWPRHEVTTDLRCYYILQLSVYLHFLLTSSSDNKRKDYWLSVLHHVTTVILMYFGWLYNFLRIGALVLLVNDAPDPWIELSKILVYSRKSRMSEFTFVIFVIVWLVSKDGIYIFRLINSTVFESYEYIHVTLYVRIFFNFFLFIVMALNLFWTFNIFEVIAHKLKHGDLKDVRSDSE